MSAADIPEPPKPTPIPREPALPMFTRPNVPPAGTPVATEEGASEYQQARSKFNAYVQPPSQLALALPPHADAPQ